MKRLKYLGWEVHLFRQEISGVSCYFATAFEMLHVEMSMDSLWDAFQKMRRHLEYVEQCILSNEFTESDGDELPF